MPHCFIIFREGPSPCAARYRTRALRSSRDGPRCSPRIARPYQKIAWECFRASCISGPCGAGSEPVVYPSLCRHAVRPSRIRSHRTYSVSGLISSLKVMTRDSDRACSLFRGKPSQKPLTIPVRKRHDRPDGLPESDSGIQGIRTHDNMPRLLLHCHDLLLRVAAKTETVSSKKVHRQSSLPFADALLLLIPVLFGR